MLWFYYNKSHDPEEYLLGETQNTLKNNNLVRIRGHEFWNQL